MPTHSNYDACSCILNMYAWQSAIPLKLQYLPSLDLPSAEESLPLHVCSMAVAALPTVLVAHEQLQQCWAG